MYRLCRNVVLDAPVSPSWVRSATHCLCSPSVLSDIGRRETDGSRNRSRASGDTKLQSFVADTGAFLYGYVIRSAKQIMRSVDGYQVLRRIGTRERKVEPSTSVC